MISYSQLTEADVEAYQRIRLHALEESPSAFTASHADEKSRAREEVAMRLAASSGSFVLAAWSDGQLVGTVGFVRSSGAKIDHRGYLWGVYVLPAFRGRGIGKELISRALQRAAAMPGLRRVHLSVTTTNAAALRVYESLGFTRYGEDAEALRVGETFYTDYLMVKIVGRE